MEARRDGTGTSSAGLFRVSGAARSAIKGSWCWPGRRRGDRRGKKEIDAEIRQTGFAIVGAQSL